MHTIFACVDGQAGTGAVVDGAIWSARRTGAPLELLHVLERHPERATHADFSGTMGVDEPDALLHELSELDARRGQLAQEAGRRMLVAAHAHAQAAGLAQVGTRMRHGSLSQTAVELEPEARLFVLGHRGPDDARPHLDHHLEQTLRSVQRPALVVPGLRFTAPQRAVIAFDGSATARKLVDRVAGSPLLAGLPVVLVTANAGVGVAPAALAEVESTLQAAGFSVETELLDGEPESAVPFMSNEDGTVLVIGAYGHSRIRQFIVGSTTTALLRASTVPVLVLR